MSDIKDSDGSDEIDFSWGTKKGRGAKNKELQFYESFTFDGVEYFLYDSVYLFKEGESKPYVGKLIKIFELPNKEKKVNILWFFYRSEISNYLRGESVLENELFLATGVGKGLTNLNPLESIAGKCNVVCISKDERNRQPSVEEVNKAHHVFYRTFNVENLTVSEKLGEKIASIRVNFLLNKNTFQSPDFSKVDSGNATINLEKLPSSSNKDTIAADGAVECDGGDGSLLVNVNKTGKCSLNKVDVATGFDDTGLVIGLKGKFIVKDSGDVTGSKGKDVAAGPDNLGHTSSNRKITQRSFESKKNDVEGKLVDENATNHVVKLLVSGKNSLEGSDLPITAAENRKSKLVVAKHRLTGAVARGLTDDRQAKKLKPGGTSPLSCDSGGTGTPKPAIVTSNKASPSIGVASGSNDRGKLTVEVNGVSNGLPKKVKPDGLTEDKYNDKFAVASVKQSKDKQGSAAVGVAASKASQPANGEAPTEDKHNMIRKMVGSGSGILKKPKSNSVIEDTSHGKLRKIPKEDPKNVKAEASQHVKEVTQQPHVKEVTQQPPDRSNWFTEIPWEDRLKEAYDQGKLVLLHNLFPGYTSSEIENIIWHGFEESCTAKVVQRSASSNRFSGQAFVIFKTREIAEKILRKLDRDCLMLPNGRPLLGSRGAVYFPPKQSSFPGHLVIDKLRHQMQRESREAVSTSHSSQPNTLEYEMAIEWRLLQDRADMWWKMLYKKQGEEMQKTKASLKSLGAK